LVVKCLYLSTAALRNYVRSIFLFARFPGRTMN